MAKTYAYNLNYDEVSREELLWALSTPGMFAPNYYIGSYEKLIDLHTETQKWAEKFKYGVIFPSKLKHIYYYVQYSERNKNFLCIPLSENFVPILLSKENPYELYDVNEIRDKFKADVASIEKAHNEKLKRRNRLRTHI